MDRVTRILWCLLFFAATQSACAVGEPAPYVDADLEAGRQAILAKNWPAALRALKKAEARLPHNPDVHNLLGFAYRNIGDLPRAFGHYERALAINPRHLGAHEYVGEAYLLRGDLAMAQLHLEELDRLCGSQCEERNDLARAIDAFRARLERTRR